MNKAYLFDVNLLVGLLWSVHSLHAKAHAWFTREKPHVLGCAFTELSFLRVSMADKTIAASFTDAEHILASFTTALGPRYRFIDKLPPASVLSRLPIRSYKEVSDLYLCELAASHHAQLATLDATIRHPSALQVV